MAASIRINNAAMAVTSTELLKTYTPATLPAAAVDRVTARATI
jgi:hypothetical protein